MTLARLACLVLGIMAILSFTGGFVGWRNARMSTPRFVCRSVAHLGLVMIALAYGSSLGQRWPQLAQAALAITMVGFISDFGVRAMERTRKVTTRKR